MVRRHSRRIGSGREALSEGWKALRRVGVVGSLSLTVGKPSQSVGSGREALPKVRKALLEGREWSGGPLRQPGVVRTPSRRDGGGRVSLTEGQE